MAQRVSINFKESAVNVITSAGMHRLGRVQRAEVQATLPNTPVKELGSPELVGRIFDLPEVSVTVGTMDVGSRNMFVLAGKDWAGAPNGTYVEAQDIKYVCLAQPFKGAGTSTDVIRTLVVPAAKLERFSLSYSAGGDSTEEFTFSATNRLFLKHDVAVQSGVVNTGNSWTLSYGGDVAKKIKSTGNHYISVFAESTGYVPQDGVASSASGQIVLNADAVSAGNIVVAIHKDNTNAWSDTNDIAEVSGQPVGVRGWGVEIYLVKDAGGAGVADDTLTRLYRVQSCSVQGQYPNQRIQELGSLEVVGYSDDIPDVTGSFELLQHDFKLGEMLSGKPYDTNDDWAPNDLGQGDYGLMIKMWPRGADRTSSQPVKTVYLPKLDITQANDSSQVGQDTRATFNFSSRTNQVFIYKGQPQ